VSDVGPGGTAARVPVAPLGIHELIGLAILTHVVFAGVRVVLTLTALHLGAAAFTVGMLLSLFSLLPMLLAIAGGRWVDRVGVRWPMIVGIVVVAIGAVLPLAWPAMPTLYLTAALVGLGFLPFHLGTQKYVAELGSPQDRRHNFSLYTIGFSVSGFLGPTISGFLIDGIGHRLAFGVMALFGVAAIAWLWRRREALPGRGSGVPAPPGSLRTLDLLKSPDMRRLYLVVAVLSSAWDVHQFLVPLYGAKIGLSASAIGLILGSFALATLVVRLMVPLFLMNISEWRVVAAAQLVAAAVYAFYPAYSTLEALLALSFALGLGLGVAQPMMLSLLARTAPANRLGEAAGLRVTMVNTTQTVLPGTFGALGAVIGIAPLFWAMALLLVGGAAGIGRFLYRTRGG
jgi:MFS family permease